MRSGDVAGRQDGRGFIMTASGGSSERPCIQLPRHAKRRVLSRLSTGQCFMVGARRLGTLLAGAVALFIYVRVARFLFRCVLPLLRVCLSPAASLGGPFDLASYPLFLTLSSLELRFTVRILDLSSLPTSHKA